ncbi:MAG TPA: AMP-binding protein [Vicinamibacterales bacterium]|nr:AMP-binding protein [Vicinamibacterales bacterium]
MNFAQLIGDACRQRPSRPAIELVRTDGRVETMTFGELDDLAGRAARWLLQRGIGRGDRVALLADNDGRWIAAYLGALRIGAVAVPLDTAYKAPQVAIVVDHCGARVLMTTPRYLDTARTAIANASTPPVLALLRAEAEGVPDPFAPVGGEPPPPLADMPDDAMAVMLYTSGTTADPKGVVLTHGNLEAERRGALAVVPVSDRDALLGVLPLFHALAQMANLLLPLASGARVVFLETINSSSLVAALASRDITLFACVPQFFYLIHQRVMAETGRRGALARGLLRGIIAGNVRIRNATGLNPARRLLGRIHRPLGPRMRLFVTGGSTFDPAIGRDLYGMGFTILNAYGLTETSGGATVMRPSDRFNSSVGQPLPGVEIRIDGGNPDGEGEILIRGPILMREYFNRPDATSEALRDGWLYTGDLGRLDREGRLYITGRKKEIIVLSSGKNLYPEEIEAHYRRSAFIKELCVLGVSKPGQPSAERLHAVVVPDEDVLRAKGIVNLKELLRFEIETLSVQLPAHKRILSYDIWMQPLPRTTTGKIRRHEIQRTLRERAATSETSDLSRPISEEDAAWAGNPANAALLALIAQSDPGGTFPDRESRNRFRPDANLELDLGLDSMERVELLTRLEQHEGARVSAEVRATIFTVRQLVDAVRSAPRAGEGTDESAELPWDTVLSTPADQAITRDLARRRPIRTMSLFLFVKLIALIAKVLPGFRSSGQAHLPPAGPYIISPNHQAYVDPVFVAAALPYRAFRELFFVGAAEYFETPLARWFARTINLVPVDPDANLVTAMRAGADGLRLHKILMLFPEGERSIDGELKKFRKGAPILSAHLDVPIVPVALDGLFELWPRGRAFNWKHLLPWRGRRISVRFGAPIRSTPGAYLQGADRLKAAVAALFAETRR